jgi:hypothetical protein
MSLAELNSRVISYTLHKTGEYVEIGKNEGFL